jgi:hypothetical protein
VKIVRWFGDRFLEGVRVEGGFLRSVGFGHELEPGFRLHVIVSSDISVGHWTKNNAGNGKARNEESRYPKGSESLERIIAGMIHD